MSSEVAELRNQLVSLRNEHKKALSSLSSQKVSLSELSYEKSQLLKAAESVNQDIENENVRLYMQVIIIRIYY